MKAAGVEELGSLRVSSLRKAVGDFTLEADFEVGVGERAALVGPSGVGKTTLLRLIAGLDAPEFSDSGGIRVGDREISRLPPRRREVGMVFQEGALFPSLDVLGNASFGLRMRGVARDEREGMALEWLTRVGLANRAGSPITVLSGGERQRVALVRTLVLRPRVLLLDEPFSALDSSLRGSLRKTLLELHALWPAPMVLVSHDEKDHEELATVRLSFERSLEDDVEVRKVVRNSIDRGHSAD